jgi:hypothetical protein
VGRLTEEKNEGSKPSEEWGPSSGLMFVAIIFLIRALYYGVWYPKNVLGDAYQGAYIFLWMIALFFFAAAVGLFLKRRFGYYLAWLLLIIEGMLSFVWLFASPLLTLAGIALIILMAYALSKSQNEIKKTDKVDKFVGMGLALLILIYLAVCVYAQTQPTPDEYYKTVSAEARQKNDTKICDKLTSGRWENCIRDFAVSNKDARKCAGLAEGNVRDQCYIDIAIPLHNATICGGVDNEGQRKVCYSLANRT